MLRPDGRASARKSFVLMVMGTVMFFLCSISSADVPDSINYQGKLTTASGGCLNDTVQMTFTIYADASGTVSEWSETQTQVEVKEGIFNVLLGSVVPLPASIFDGSTKYLGVQVESDPEMTPLKPMVSVAYAYRSSRADTANYAHVGDNDWYFRVTDGADTSLITGGSWGIARSGNILHGNADSTHVNLGVACTTGTSGQDHRYCTIGGGLGNNASKEYATIAGGRRNRATVEGATVGGGGNNIATHLNATVAGGYTNTANGYGAAVGGGHYNIASGDRAAVGGGEVNDASGNYATVPGGQYNSATGDYGFAAGLRAKANHSGTFVWSDGAGGNFASTGQNQFLIRASGGVGIGTPSPEEELDVAGRVQVTGFKMPTGSASGHLLTSDASGIGTWQPAPDTVNFARRADTANVALNSMFGQVYQDADLDSTNASSYIDLKTIVVPGGTYSTGFMVSAIGYFRNPEDDFGGGFMNIVVDSAQKIENGGWTAAGGTSIVVGNFRIPISVMYYVDENDPDWNPSADVTVRIQGRRNAHQVWVCCSNLIIFGH